LIAILLTAALAAATPAQPGPTLAQWAAQDADTRRIALVGAVEGVLLATSAVNGLAVPVNTDCFNNQTPQFLDAALVAMARTAPGRPLAEGLISIEQCARRAVAR
jgi:hypothetical protein